jgi:hypothetical protein
VRTCDFVDGQGLSLSVCCADDAPAEGQAEAGCSPPLFKRPVRAARRTIPHTDGASDEEDEEMVPVEGPARPREHMSGSQVAEAARRGRKQLVPGRAAVDGSAVKGPYDEQTWNTLVELGYAPTPAQGQSGTFRTPREFNPAAATPPLVHTDALAGCKRTPPSGPEGSSPPVTLLSAAKMVSSRTPAFARKRSVAAELAAAAALGRDAAQPTGPSSRGDASSQQVPIERGSSAAEPHDAMAVLAAAAADSEEKSERQQQLRRQQEPFTPTSSAKRRALAGPDRDDALDGLVRPLLFTSPLLSLSSPALGATPAQQHSVDAAGRPTPRHSPQVLRQMLHLVPPIVFPQNSIGAGPPRSQATQQAEVGHIPYNFQSSAWCLPW